MAFAIIALFLATGVDATPREAVVVGRRCDSGRTRRKFDFHSGGKLVAGKKLYHPVKCAADAKLGALARGMAQGHNSMETMSTPRQDMLVGALEGFLEDLPSS